MYQKQLFAWNRNKEYVTKYYIMLELLSVEWMKKKNPQNKSELLIIFFLGNINWRQENLTWRFPVFFLIKINASCGNYFVKRCFILEKGFFLVILNENLLVAIVSHTIIQRRYNYLFFLWFLRILHFKFSTH